IKMKLISFGLPGKEKPGVITEAGDIVDVSGFTSRFDEDFFANNGLSSLEDWLKQNISTAPVVDDGVRLGSPIYRPGKIICIGLNYSDHAAESKMELPKEPVVFFKATSAVCGPNDDLVIPKGSKKTDWEVELAVVI